MNIAVEQYFIQELLSFSDSSSSDDEVQARGPMNIRPKIKDYIKNTVDAYTDEEFRNNFWMGRDTFNNVLDPIQHDITNNVTEAGHNTIPARSQLLLALWYLATPDSYRSVCSRFNIGKATVLRTVRRVAKALCGKSAVIIKWPITAEECNIITEGFSAKGFPDTLGAIDGCQIPFPLPKEHGISYINRHNTSSLILQGICDHRLKFIHCYAGEAGSSHDARVLKKSEIWSRIMHEQDVYFPNNTHLIGDKAYPCLPQLLVPFKDTGNLTEVQKPFNFRLSAARSTIERAFALLKGRFRCLKYLDVKRVDWAPIYIMVCCVLHNICLDNNDLVDIPELPHEDDNALPDEYQPENNRRLEREILDMGKEKIMGGFTRRYCEGVASLNVKVY